MLAKRGARLTQETVTQPAGDTFLYSHADLKQVEIYFSYKNNGLRNSGTSIAG